MRVAYLEQQMSGIYTQYATVSDRLNRFLNMLDRINTRLGLTEADTAR